MSQPFHQEADPPRSGTGKWFILGPLLILIAVIILAEVGVLSLQTTEVRWETRSNDNTSKNGFLTLRGFRFAPVVTVVEPSASGKSIANYAAEAIRKASSEGGGGPMAKLQITINQVSTSGADWVPFYKQGSCDFSATYELEAVAGGSSIVIQGQITGKVEQSMKGICSTSLFRQEMGKAVASAIAGDIQKVIVRNG